MPNNKYTFFLTLYVALHLCIRGDEKVSILLTWMGAISPCINCSIGEYATTFACSDGRGNWNDGEIDFTDPIPNDSGNVLHNVTTMIRGWYGCNESAQALELLVLNGNLEYICSLLFYYFIIL